MRRLVPLLPLVLLLLALPRDASAQCNGGMCSGYLTDDSGVAIGFYCMQGEPGMHCLASTTRCIQGSCGFNAQPGADPDVAAMCAKLARTGKKAVAPRPGTLVELRPRPMAKRKPVKARWAVAERRR